MATAPDIYACHFPGCDQAGETTVMREGGDGVPLCAAHLELMVNKPEELRPDLAAT